MEKIAEYKTATADNMKSLDLEVNKLISQGFQPYGSPYLSDNAVEGRVDVFTVAQAMVKYETRKPGTTTIGKVQGI